MTITGYTPTASGVLRYENMPTDGVSSVLRWSVQPRSSAANWGAEGYDALVVKTDLDGALAANTEYTQFILKSRWAWFGLLPRIPYFLFSDVREES